MIREASHWSSQAGRDFASAEDVQQAIDERIYRHNRIEHLFRDQIDTGKKLIAARGTEVGQINGLSVSQVGEHAFGQPFSNYGPAPMSGTAGVISN